MRGSITHFIMLLLFLTGHSSTQVVPKLPEPDKDPFVGTWKANAEKSRPKLDKVEASYVRTISRDGDERVLASRVSKNSPAPVIKGKDYSEFRENHWRIRCDGLAHLVTSGMSSKTVFCAYQTANRVEGESHIEIACPAGERCLVEGGKDQYWTEEVPADGQEMTILDYSDKARTKVKRTEVLDRVK